MRNRCDASELWKINPELPPSGGYAMCVRVCVVESILLESMPQIRYKHILIKP